MWEKVEAPNLGVMMRMVAGQVLERPDQQEQKQNREGSEPTAGLNVQKSIFRCFRGSESGERRPNQHERCLLRVQVDGNEGDNLLGPTGAEDRTLSWLLRV